MPRYFLSILLVLSTAIIKAQPPLTPPEAEPFIIKGFDVLDYQAGDLNNDKRPDAILILKQPGEDSVMEESAVRPLILLIRQADGKLKQVLRNDSAVLCRHCGGVFGDPYEGVNIYENGFSISFYGGSSWRWGYTYDFAWRPAKKTWLLVKESQSSFQAGDPEATMKNTEIEETELGEIPLGNFNSDFPYENSKWKVIAVKTFFYDNPKTGSKPRKAYLLKGNIATGIRHLKNFIELSFENSKGKITTGYVLKKDLEAIK